MRIIEITGVAGAGKSYILDKLIEDRYVVSDSELMNQYHIGGIYLFYLFLKETNNFKLLQTIFDIAKELNMSLFDRLNFIRNTVKKIGKNRYLSNIEFIDNRVVVIDEGISHIYQNVVTTKTQNNLKILILLNQLISLIDKLPNRVIIVDAHSSTIIRRLKNRGHRRLNSVEEREIEIFVEKSKKNLSVVPKVFKDIKVVINEVGLDLKSLDLIERGGDV
jgi:dephospho-CoA kinase